YRTRKFMRRNRVRVAAAGTVIVALSAGLGAAIVKKRRAETEAETSKALSDFLQNDLLAQASARTQSTTHPNPDLKVRDALDRAAAGVAVKFGSRPLVEASIHHTIGMTYRDLGLYDKAAAQIESAVTLRRRVFGPQHRETLASMDELALTYL